VQFSIRRTSGRAAPDQESKKNGKRYTVDIAFRHEEVEHANRKGYSLQSYIADIGDALTLSGFTPPGGLFVSEIARRYSNTGFATGSFRAISIEGIN